MEQLEESPLNIGEIKKNTFKENLRQIVANITVEPILLSYIISTAISKLATQNLNLEKACRVNMKYSDEICDSLIAKKGNMYVKEEISIQELVTKMERWKNILLTAIPMLVLISMGAWSDKSGKRKICMLIPVVAELLVCLSNILNVYFFYELPLEATMFLEAIFPAVTGGMISLLMAIFSYLSNITSEESRTTRLGILSLCITTGKPIGTLLSGILLDKIGYYGVFTITSVIYTFSFLYGQYFIKDPERVVTENLEKASSIWSVIKSFFDIKHVKDIAKIAIKNEPKGRRTKCIVMLLSLFFVIGTVEGEETVKYMFTRYCFNWNVRMYSYYNFFYICIHTLGALISITLFSYHLKWDDSVLGMISTVSKIIGSIAVAIAGSTRDMYIAVVLETLNATAFTALRSTSTKLCSNDEIGKMTSLFNLIEIAGLLAFKSIYSTLYLNILSIDPRIIFYASAAFTIPPLVNFGWFYMQHKKAIRAYKRRRVEEYMDPN